MKKRLLFLLAGCIVLHWYIKSALMNEKHLPAENLPHSVLLTQAVTQKT